MKKFKEIIAQLNSTSHEDGPNFQDLLLKYICYSPKMQLRFFQESLIESAEKMLLTVKDSFFSGEELRFSTFKWGSGSRRIVLTHGWASKAADFYDLITALQQVDNLQIVAFDAPGNGSSEGELSSLMLFIEAVKAVVEHFGQPEVTIGHSLGAMANIIATSEMNSYPRQIISIAPMINLGANFRVSMDALKIGQEDQNIFFKQFEERFQKPVSHFNLIEWADVTTTMSKHWVAYDANDSIAPFTYTKAFLEKNALITSKDYLDTGHEKIIRSPNVIHDVLNILQ